tara:strand:- start:45 stop:407 length:363 start_codon:yes stop_codon:yes gene_type:complete
MKLNKKLKKELLEIVKEKDFKRYNYYGPPLCEMRRNSYLKYNNIIGDIIGKDWERIKLSRNNVKQLKIMCKEHKIKNYSQLRKRQLIEKLYNKIYLEEEEIIWTNEPDMEWTNKVLWGYY